jgi:hypothetical protein
MVALYKPVLCWWCLSALFQARALDKSKKHVTPHTPSTLKKERAVHEPSQLRTVDWCQPDKSCAEQTTIRRHVSLKHHVKRTINSPSNLEPEWLEDKPPTVALINKMNKEETIIQKGYTTLQGKTFKEKL